MTCAHGPCTCLVEDVDSFCSEACSEMADLGDGCGCPHAGCEATPDKRLSLDRLGSVTSQENVGSLTSQIEPGAA